MVTINVAMLLLLLCLVLRTGITQLWRQEKREGGGDEAKDAGCLGAARRLLCCARWQSKPAPPARKAMYKINSSKAFSPLADNLPLHLSEVKVDVSGPRVSTEVPRAKDAV